MLKKCVFIVALLSGVLLTQCGVEKIVGLLENTKEGEQYSFNAEPRELKPEEVKLTAANNRFGLKLFKEIILEEQDKNVFISPLSVSMALGMTYNGAAGTTEDAMRNTLEYGDLTQQEINESYRYLSSMLANLDPMAKFQIANSIWYRLGFHVEKEFIDINQTYFDAEVTGLNFDDPNAKDIINNWVNQKTNGKIPDIIYKIDPENVMFLINAIYFKGIWKYEFDPNDTQDGLFTLPDGSKKPCRMMMQGNNFQYLQNEYFQAIDLPYGDTGFSMTIFLPEPDVHIDNFIAQINDENLSDWFDSFNETEMLLSMPKFKLEYDLTLNDVLKALGMEIAFELWQADFTNINKNGGLFISEVKHKTFVDVNEEGTEAAAVTVVTISPTSEPDYPSMIVNRPFVFMIREKFTNTILFMGKIVEPVLE